MSNNNDKKQAEKKRLFSETTVFIFLICVALVLLYAFLYYNSLYIQSKDGAREVVYGPIDKNSAEFGYSHYTAPTVQFSIDGTVYKAPTKRLGGSLDNSIQPVIDELNTKDDITVACITLVKFNLKREKICEIIGLKIDGTEYLNPDESVKELTENYKTSKNTCLVFFILALAFSALYFFLNIYRKKLRKKQT